MKQFTIKQLFHLLETDESFKTISKTDNKRLYLDKCNWFISAILRSNTQIEDERLLQNINSKTLKTILGDRYYKDIIKSLQNLDLIYVNNRYSVNRFSKSYLLTEKAFKIGIITDSIHSERFRNTLKNYFKKRYEEINKNPLIKKILTNTIKLFLTDNAPKYLAKILPTVTAEKPISNLELLDLWLSSINDFTLSRYDAYFSSFRLINQINNPSEIFNLPIFFEPSISKTGRVFHLVASAPKLIRKSFLTKAREEIYEIDMSSAQPSLLMLEWLGSLKLKQLRTEQNEEATLCLNLVLNGEIYSYITKNSSFLSQMEYSKMKQSILTTLNDKIRPTKLYRELFILFPNFMKWIDNIKENEGYKQVSFIGQSAEAKIFVSVYNELPSDMFSLIIHDCIITTNENTDLVKTLLIKKVKEIYQNVLSKNSDLDRLFKVEKVSEIITYN